MRATIDRFGRVVVPKEFRDKLGLQPGSEILIDQQDSEIVIRAAGQASPLQDEGGVLVFAGSATGVIASAVQRQRERRLHKLSPDNSL